MLKLSQKRYLYLDKLFAGSWYYRRDENQAYPASSQMGEYDRDSAEYHYCQEQNPSGQAQEEESVYFL